MQSFLIESESEWVKWQGDWDRLAADNPMLCMPWLQSWWHAFGSGHQLSILAVMDDQAQMVAALPLYCHTTSFGKQLRFLGSGTAASDYLTALVDRRVEPQASQALIEGMGDCLAAQWRGVLGFRLEGMRTDDAWSSRWQSFAASQRFSFRSQPLVSSWSLALPDTWEALIVSQRGKNIQRKSKKAAARFRAGELVIRQLDRADDYQEGMENLVRLHQARRESAGDEGCFRDPAMAEFLQNAMKRMLAVGKARFCLCEHQGQPIAAQMHLLSSTTVFMYQTGADPHFMNLEPGHSIIAGAIQKAIEEGRKHYDFLRGDEPYKGLWCATAIPLTRYILAARTIKAQAIESVHRQLGWLKAFSQQTLLPMIQRAE